MTRRLGDFRACCPELFALATVCDVAFQTARDEMVRGRCGIARPEATTRESWTMSALEAMRTRGTLSGPAGAAAAETLACGYGLTDSQWAWASSFAAREFLRTADEKVLRREPIDGTPAPDASAPARS